MQVGAQKITYLKKILIMEQKKFFSKLPIFFSLVLAQFKDHLPYRAKVYHLVFLDIPKKIKI